MYDITDKYVNKKMNVTLQSEVYICSVGELHFPNESDDNQQGRN